MCKDSRVITDRSFLADWVNRQTVHYFVVDSEIDTTVFGLNRLFLPLYTYWHTRTYPHSLEYNSSFG